MTPGRHVERAVPGGPPVSHRPPVSPFPAWANLAFLWLGPFHRDVLDTLRSAVLGNEGLLVLTGDVGTGKTVMAKALLANLGDAARAIEVPHPAVDPADLFAIVGRTLGFDPGDGIRVSFLKRLERVLETSPGGAPVLIVVDEAQGLKAGLFPEIDHVLRVGAGRLSVLLVGQNELHNRLADASASDLASRIRLSRALRPLTRDEIGEYVEHQLRVAGIEAPLFTAEALHEIAVTSGGIPRLINMICHQTLRTTEQQHAERIDAQIVKRSAAVSGERALSAGMRPRPSPALTVRRVASALKAPRPAGSGGPVRVVVLVAALALAAAAVGYVSFFGRTGNESPRATGEQSAPSVAVPELAPTAAPAGSATAAASPAPGLADPALDVSPPPVAETPAAPARERRQRSWPWGPPGPGTRGPVAQTVPPATPAPTPPATSPVPVPPPPAAPPMPPPPAASPVPVPPMPVLAPPMPMLAPPAASPRGDAGTFRRPGDTEANDPGAVIDWLLKEYPARRP